MKRKTQNEGFTLIEVALAIVVVAVGLMAVFKLIGSGLDQSRRTVAESYSAILANSVFHGLRAGALAATESDPANGFQNFWNTTVKSANGIPVPAGDVWEDRLYVQGDGNIHPLVFENKTLTGADTGIKNYALRYRLTVNTPLTASSADSTWLNLAKVTFQVWDGEKGGTLDPNAYTYYSEFRDPGGI